MEISNSRLDNGLAQEFQRNCALGGQQQQATDRQLPSDNNNSFDCVNNMTISNKNITSSSIVAADADLGLSDDGYEKSTCSSSSGRSSTSSHDDEQQHRIDTPESQTSNSSGVPVLNAHSNQFPLKFVHLAEQLRVKFLDELEQQQQQQQLDNESYDEYDINELKRQPIPNGEQRAEQSVAFRWISRFINSRALLEAGATNDEKIQKELDEAYERFKEFMKFRAQFSVSHAMADQFASEFYIMSGIFSFGTDKHGLPVLYLRARIHRRWSAKLNESFQRYVAWQIDNITKSNPQAKVISRSVGSSGREKDGSFGICFDCLSVSYSCLDMDFLRYLVRILVHSYPTYCRYALCVDLPWIFRSVWKLVRSWLPEDAQNSVQLITSKQLTDYIDEDQIPNSIKFNDRKSSEKPATNKHQLPTNYSSIRGIKELANELNLSSNEVKQFTSHIDKIRKEYEQLGAI